MARVGQRFTHHTFLDPTWRPGPGQTYKRDAPRAQMVVTRVKMYTVFYRYAEQTHKQASRPAWAMDAAEFDRRYPQGASGPQEPAEPGACDVLP